MWKEEYFIRDGRLMKCNVVKRSGNSEMVNLRHIKEETMERNVWATRANTYPPDFFATITTKYPYNKQQLEKRLIRYMTKFRRDKRVRGGNHIVWLAAGEEQPKRCIKNALGVDVSDVEAFKKGEEFAYHIHIIGWFEKRLTDEEFRKTEKAFKVSWDFGIADYQQYEIGGGATFYTLNHPNHIEGKSCRFRNKCRRNGECCYRHRWEDYKTT